MDKRHFFQQTQNSFRQYLFRIGYTKSTMNHYLCYTGKFFDFLRKRHIDSFNLISTQLLIDYTVHLQQQPISSKTISHHYNALKALDKYLQQHGEHSFLTIDLKINTETPTRVVLSQKQIQALYTHADTSLYGYLQRAILALFYGCGLRASEGIELKEDDLVFKTGLLLIKKAKNNHQRYVPMSESVQEDLQQWLAHGKRLLQPQSPYVLVHAKGAYQSSHALNIHLKRLVNTAGIDKHITLHNLRHSIATHLIEQGMKLEQVGLFLGHKSIQATQKYTHINYE